MSEEVQRLFEHVCDLSRSDREAFLDAACEDSIVRSDVESLLDAHEAAGAFMENPTADYVPGDSSMNSAPLGVQEGDAIGRYKLLQRIGEGGFGVVFMAQQSRPLKRKVALKIIKLGMDTKQVVARFEAERQALAMMNHPNIARVLDGGATKSGRPYFVMELVRGEPITKYCDRKKLKTSERLLLFEQVCLAVQHAHQKGIIHRDIKPTNVLVTVADDKPVVKVIDFGIAKATNSELTEKTLFTEFRQLIGTPEYMSPEQAERSGVDVDTRTDIYSLGVLLYEILTGTTPFDFDELRSEGWGPLQEIILDEEPPPPSTRVSTMKDELDTVASARSIDPSRLTTVLKGELDWIVMKAMEKDRARRYSTAAELADDMRRYRLNEPVLAGPPSSLYRFRKFVRRHKGPIAASATVVAALLLGIVASTCAMFWALSERDKAIAAKQQAVQAELRAQQESARAKRFSHMAGNLMMSPDEMQRDKANWQREIDELKAKLPEDDIERVRQECQFATWLFYQGLVGESEEIRNEAADILEALIREPDASWGLKIFTFSVWPMQISTV